MLTDNEISAIVGAEESDALSYRDELGEKRKLLLDYYNQKPYGDEVDGRSKFVSSDVADVVEGMLPSLLRVFTQGKHVARFEADQAEFDDEADQKTQLANYVFYRQNDGVLTLHNMFKDALLQYTGTVKVSWREHTSNRVERYSGLSEFEFNKLQSEEGTTLSDVEQRLTVEGVVFDCVATVEKTMSKVDYDNVPPEEFIISRNARNFVKPRLIGHRPPVTRSDLVAMGFPRDLVESLPRNDQERSNQEDDARNKGATREANPTMDPANDVFYLGEYYMWIDVDEDGETELWQIFKVGNTILQKERWDEHPFAVVVPVPIPHRAVGSCPAEQVADIQLTKSVLGRQGLDNIYSTNYQRMAYNDRVDLDDLFTPRPGGGIHIEGEGPIGDSLLPVTSVPQTDGILSFIEYMDISREIRTGVTRYNQGLDADSLNKTATGFKGIMEASLQRMDLIARLFAETGVKELFRKTVSIVTKNQDTTTQIRVTGEPLEIDPTSWRQNLDCHVNIGSTNAARVEKILNLNNVYERQKEALELGLPLSDPSKMFETLDELTKEVGLLDGERFFNDPSQDPTMELKAFLFDQQVAAQQQANPLAEAEAVKGQFRLAEKQVDANAEMQQFMLKLQQDQQQHFDDLTAKLTELELKFGENVPGSAV